MAHLSRIFVLREEARAAVIWRQAFAGSPMHWSEEVHRILGGALCISFPPCFATLSPRLLLLSYLLSGVFSIPSGPVIRITAA